MAEVVRIARFLNFIPATWAILAPFVFSGAVPESAWSAGLSGVAVILLSVPKGGQADHYGTWDAVIR
jgi:hypothetical protein